jgi:3-oxoadipate enol-lactonase
MIDDENGLDYFVSVQGNGEPIVVIHGLGCDHTLWKPQMKVLSDFRTVIAYDVRGHGQTSRSTNYTLFNHAEDLKALIKFLGYEKVTLMGISMGTYICQQFITRYPDMVDKLILAATKSHGQTSSMQKLVDEKRAAGESVEIETIMELAAKACFREGAPKEQVAVFYESFKYNTLDSYMEAMRAITDFDFRPQLPNVKAPTLVINGSLDVLTTLEQAREVKRLIPNAELAVMEGCGHLCNIEEPEEFNNHLIRFLTS